MPNLCVNNVEQFNRPTVQPTNDLTGLQETWFYFYHRGYALDDMGTNLFTSSCDNNAITKKISPGDLLVFFTGDL